MCVVVSSLWEDPGFVLVEAGFNNCQVVSSNCPNGPTEIVGEDGGYLFESNSVNSLIKNFNLFFKDTNPEITSSGIVKPCCLLFLFKMKL